MIKVEEKCLILNWCFQTGKQTLGMEDMCDPEREKRKA